MGKIGKPTRPILRYPGGKWRLAPKIIQWFPHHKIYVEPFGGAASILLRKDPVDIEVYNDVNSDVVTLFRVLRDQVDELLHRLWLTPWSREEFEDCLEYDGDDPIEIARYTIVRFMQGMGSSSSPGHWKTSRADEPTLRYDWYNYFFALPMVVERLRNTYIEHKDYAYVIAKFDTTNTLFYVDPPYLVEGGQYTNSMSEVQHIELAEVLNKIDGFAVVSATDSELYRHLYQDWIWKPLLTLTLQRRKKTEFIIMNYEFMEDGDG